jgi:hypothetical protein
MQFKNLTGLHWTDLEMPEEESEDETDAKSHEPGDEEE